MKIFHLSDLHIGKSVHEYSMKEEQIHILNEILRYIREEEPQVVILSGDIYDKSVPSIEAVKILDDFFTELATTNTKVLVISGNHDSSYRLNFANQLLKKSNIYIEGVFTGKVRVESFEDEYGEVNFYMLPFIKPMDVSGIFKDKQIQSYNDAVKAVIESTHLDTTKRNVMIAHQFVTGAISSDSEINIGTLDNIDGHIFDEFDYVALGHIHKPQKVLRETMRYSGTPLSYSFSEKNDKKSITVIELKEKDDIDISFLPLEPIHKMIEVKGELDDILANATKTEDYVKVILTDEVAVDALEKLQTVYPNIMQIAFEDKMTSEDYTTSTVEDVIKKDKIELFSDFYKEVTGESLEDGDIEYLIKCIESNDVEEE